MWAHEMSTTRMQVDKLGREEFKCTLIEFRPVGKSWNGKTVFRNIVSPTPVNDVCIIKFIVHT